MFDVCGPEISVVILGMTTQLTVRWPQAPETKGSNIVRRRCPRGSQVNFYFSYLSGDIRKEIRKGVDGIRYIEWTRVGGQGYRRRRSIGEVLSYTYVHGQREETMERKKRRK